MELVAFRISAERSGNFALKNRCSFFKQGLAIWLDGEHHSTQVQKVS